MKEEIIAENQEYIVKKIENPKLEEFLNPWKALQSNFSVYMTYESICSYVRNYGNVGDIVLFVLEKKASKSLDAIFPLRRKKYFFIEKYFFLYPKLGFDYDFLSFSIDERTKKFFLENIFSNIHAHNCIVSLAPVNQKFADELSENAKLEQLKTTQSDFPEHLYVLMLPKSWQELLNSFNRNFRKNQLNRYQRKMMKDFSVSFENTKNLKENKNSYEKFLILHKNLIKSKGKLTPFEYKSFRDYIFSLISEFENDAGAFSIRLNNDIACILLYIDWNNTRYFLNIGVSPEYKKYSIARLLLAHVIEDAINKGMKYFDFGQGDEKYKEDGDAKNSRIKI
jgi:ribosomal protein S18 acetylase RimI-like enzyme